MQLFYNPDLDPSASEAVLPKDESRHIVKVLRKIQGDRLELTDGKGFFYKAEITLASANSCQVKIIETSKVLEQGYKLHMAVAPTKLNDRFEIFLEKATEIGIDAITPIICEHSERKVIKPERYERILQSAMKQSLKAFLPKLNKSTTFLDFVEQNHNYYEQFFIAHCGEDQRFSLKERLQPHKNTMILIGPEGDFSPSEIQLALNNRFVPVTMGDSRLRTETAAIAAVHSVAFINTL